MEFDSLSETSELEELGSFILSSGEYDDDVDGEYDDDEDDDVEDNGDGNHV